MPKERKRKNRVKLRHHVANDLLTALGQRPRILPPHQRAKPERSPEFFAERKVLKQERANLIMEAHAAKQEGRPSEYKGKPHDDMVLALRLLGCTAEMIAAAMFIDQATITRWRNEHPMFNAAWLSGGDAADAIVAEKMYQKAIGYKMPVTKVFFDSKNGEVVEHDMVEHFPPDQKAIEFILTNKQRGVWRHRQDSSLVDNDGNSILPPTINILPVAAPPRPNED